jgi:hypothetical protein
MRCHSGHFQKNLCLSRQEQLLKLLQFQKILPPPIWSSLLLCDLLDLRLTTSLTPLFFSRRTRCVGLPASRHGRMACDLHLMLEVYVSACSCFSQNSLPHHFVVDALQRPQFHSAVANPERDKICIRLVPKPNREKAPTVPKHSVVALPNQIICHRHIYDRSNRASPLLAFANGCLQPQARVPANYLRSP